jgi:hypothetical protein
VPNAGTGTFNDLASGDKTWFRTLCIPMRSCIKHHFKGDKAAFVSEWGGHVGTFMLFHQSSIRSTALERGSTVVFLLQKVNSEISVLFGVASKI